MFDKLIVSEPQGADFKNRTRYFATSAAIVGFAFAVALVVSIYAADYSLGTSSFEMVELIAPVDPVAQTEPEPPRQRAPISPARSTSELPTRQVNMRDVSESPVDVPPVSTSANNQKARPEGNFHISSLDSDPAPSSAGTGRDTTGTTGPSTLAALSATADTVPATEPPPAKPPTPPAAHVTKTMGVVNGLAQSLPKPAYPAAALAVNIQGKVDVQVLIDESGRVVSAKAISGNALLKQAAEQAARNARFSPTTLSNVPVKVTGVIIYNFSRG